MSKVSLKFLFALILIQGQMVSAESVSPTSEIKKPLSPVKKKLLRGTPTTQNSDGKVMMIGSMSVEGNGAAVINKTQEIGTFSVEGTGAAVVQKTVSIGTFTLEGSGGAVVNKTVEIGAFTIVGPGNDGQTSEGAANLPKIDSNKAKLKLRVPPKAETTTPAGPQSAPAKAVTEVAPPKTAETSQTTKVPILRPITRPRK